MEKVIEFLKYEQSTFYVRMITDKENLDANYLPDDVIDRGSLEQSYKENKGMYDGFERAINILLFYSHHSK